MRELMASVLAAQSEEYSRAKDKFGPTHSSDHESYAVLKEEIEEASEELTFILRSLDRFWKHVRDNETAHCKKRELADLKRQATLLACEAIQVAAMAHKSILTLEAAKE